MTGALLHWLIGDRLRRLHRETDPACERFRGEPRRGWRRWLYDYGRGSACWLCEQPRVDR